METAALQVSKRALHPEMQNEVDLGADLGVVCQQVVACLGGVVSLADISNQADTQGVHGRAVHLVVAACGKGVDVCLGKGVLEHGCRN